MALPGVRQFTDVPDVDTTRFSTPWVAVLVAAAGRAAVLTALAVARRDGPLAGRAWAGSARLSDDHRLTLEPTVTAPRGLPVRTRGLVHVYRGEGRDVAALSGIDLTVRAGEMIGLLGPSGAGKSTLLSLLAGLFQPTAGTVLVGELDLTKAASRELDALHATDVSLMLQGAGRNLLPFLTPDQNIAFAQQARAAAGRRRRTGCRPRRRCSGWSASATRATSRSTG